MEGIGGTVFKRWLAKLWRRLERGWLVVVLVLVLVAYTQVFALVNRHVVPEGTDMPGVFPEFQLSFTVGRFTDVLQRWAAEPCRPDDPAVRVQVAPDGECVWLAGVGSVRRLDGDPDPVQLAPAVTERIPNGARVYAVWHVWLIDLLFPLLYAATGMALIAWAWGGRRGPPSRCRALLLLIPLAAAVCDWTENFLHYALLWDVSDIADVGKVAAKPLAGLAVFAASTFAAIKVALLVTTVLVAAAGLRPRRAD